MMKRNLIALALLCILAMAFLVTPVAAGLTIVDGATISATDGATSPVITITDDLIAGDGTISEGGTITIDISAIHDIVDDLGRGFTIDNVELSDTAAAATWTGVVLYDDFTDPANPTCILTLTSTGGPTIAGETVTVTFTGAKPGVENPWYIDYGDTAFRVEFELTATRTDGNGADTFNFVLTPALTFSSAATTTDGTKVLVTFSKDVYDDPLLTAPDGFTISVNGADNAVSDIDLNGADNRIVELTLDTAILVKTDVVLVSYAPGTVQDTDTYILAAFDDEPVTNNVVPIVTGIVPSHGPEAGGTEVIITGTGFTGATTVNFGAIPGVAPLTVNPDGTQITITSPAEAAGLPVDVTVTTPGGTSATSGADQFTYDPAPIVTNINPKTGINSGSVSFTIDGTDFVNGAGLTISLRRPGYADIDATKVVWVNPTQITCDFTITGAATGDWNIIVRNPDGQNSLTGPNNLFQMIALTVANAPSSSPSDPADSDTGGTAGTGTGQSTASASVENPVEPGAPGAPASAATGTMTAELSVNDQGVVTETTELQSADGVATVSIDPGVVALDQAGAPVASVSIDTLAPSDMPDVPSGGAVSFAGVAYELQPDGAQFSPAISISFAVPAGQAGQDLTVRTYDHATGNWVELPTTYDPQTGTVTAQVSHFCCFALFTKIVTTAPAIAATPAPTQLIHTTVAPPPPTAMSTFTGMILWVVNLLIKNPMVIAGIVILAVGIVFFVWKRRRDRLIYRP